MKKKFSARRTLQRIRTVPGLGRNVAAVVAVIALGITTVAIIYSNVDYTPPWAQRYEFAADFAEAPAVAPTQHPKVRIAGVDVGKVTGSEPTADGKARLTFELQPGHKIYDNAQLVLRPKNPINEMYVEVSPGGPPGKPLPRNGVIPVGQTKRPIQPDQVLQHLDDRTRNALSGLLATSDTALANAPRTLPAGLDKTNDALMSLRPVLRKLEERRGKVRELVTSLSQITTAVGGNNERLAGLADSTQQALGTLSKRDSDLRATLEELPGTTQQLGGAMDSVQGLTSELDPTLDNLRRASGELPGALQRATNTVDNLGRTVRAAKPVVAKAGPVVNDLRPLVGDLNGSLSELEPLSRTLQPVTKQLVPYLTDLQAFIFNTSSVFRPADANGGFVRGHVALPLPDGGVLPGAHSGNAFPDTQRAPNR